MSELMVEAYEFLIKSLKKEHEELHDSYFENIEREMFNYKSLIRYVSEEIGYEAALKMCEAADQAYKEKYKKSTYGFDQVLETLDEENDDE